MITTYPLTSNLLDINYDHFPKHVNCSLVQALCALTIELSKAICLATMGAVIHVKWPGPDQKCQLMFQPNLHVGSSFYSNKFHHNIYVLEAHEPY